MSTKNTKLRVVVAEDDPSLLERLADSLHRANYEVVERVTGAADMHSAILAHAPDLVVFDVHLGDGDGLVSFRDSSRYCSVVGVAVTGDRTQTTATRAVETDVFAFLIKPFTDDQLWAAVDLAVTQGRRLARLRSDNEALASALSDPQEAVARVKAQCERDGINSHRTHKYLIQIGHDEGVDLHGAALLVLNGVYRIGSYCNRVTPRDDTKKNRRPNPARSEASPAPRS